MSSPRSFNEAFTQQKAAVEDARSAAEADRRLRDTEAARDLSEQQDMDQRRLALRGDVVDLMLESCVDFSDLMEEEGIAPTVVIVGEELERPELPRRSVWDRIQMRGYGTRPKLEEPEDDDRHWLLTSQRSIVATKMPGMDRWGKYGEQTYYRGLALDAAGAVTAYSGEGPKAFYLDEVAADASDHTDSENPGEHSWRYIPVSQYQPGSGNGAKFHRTEVSAKGESGDFGGVAHTDEKTGRPNGGIVYVASKRYGDASFLNDDGYPSDELIVPLRRIDPDVSGDVHEQPVLQSWNRHLSRLAAELILGNHK